MVALVVSGCTTPDVPTWPNGISAADEKAISRLVHAQTSESILTYWRDEDGSIRLHMSGAAQHTFVVHQIRGKWRIVNEYVIVY